MMHLLADWLMLGATFALGYAAVLWLVRLPVYPGRVAGDARGRAHVLHVEHLEDVERAVRITQPRDGDETTAPG